MNPSASRRLGVAIFAAAAVVSIVYSLLVYQDVLALPNSAASGLPGIGDPLLEMLGFVCGALLVLAALFIKRGLRS